MRKSAPPLPVLVAVSTEPDSRHLVRGLAMGSLAVLPFWIGVVLLLVWLSGR